MARYIVGAYAASPCTDGWNADLESRFFSALEQAGFVGGLELPFTGAVHPHDPDWLLRNVRRDWSIVLTTIPGTMGQLAKDPEFGLASSSDPGRAQAVGFLSSAREAVQRLNEALGRPAVLAVEIHSAPRPAAGVEPQSDALRRSLDEVRDWDWGGAVLSVEHCDAHIAGQPPEKGFLDLDAEIAAIRASAGDTAVGVAVNWGRSAIEARDPQAPRRHLQRARDQGVLNGLIFSGAAMGDALYGDWADRHAPFAAGEDDRHRLLTAARARECLGAVEGMTLRFLGFKIQPLPKELSIPERVGVLRRAAEILDQAALP
jgi:hypothetical protein